MSLPHERRAARGVMAFFAASAYVSDAPGAATGPGGPPTGFGLTDGGAGAVRADLSTTTTLGLGCPAPPWGVCPGGVVAAVAGAASAEVGKLASTSCMAAPISLLADSSDCCSTTVAAVVPFEASAAATEARGVVEVGAGGGVEATGAEGVAVTGAGGDVEAGGATEVGGDVEAGIRTSVEVSVGTCPWTDVEVSVGTCPWTDVEVSVGACPWTDVEVGVGASPWTDVEVSVGADTVARAGAGVGAGQWSVDSGPSTSGPTSVLGLD